MKLLCQILALQLENLNTYNSKKEKKNEKNLFGSSKRVVQVRSNLLVYWEEEEEKISIFCTE